MIYRIEFNQVNECNRWRNCVILFVRLAKTNYRHPQMLMGLI